MDAVQPSTRNRRHPDAGRDGHRRIRRTAGSHTFFGDFDPAGDRVLFQDTNRNRSNVRCYRIDTDDFASVHAKINTELWEWAPDISSEFILFGRNKFATGSSPWRIMLYDRIDDHGPGARSRAEPVQVHLPGVGERAVRGVEEVPLAVQRLRVRQRGGRDQQDPEPG